MMQGTIRSLAGLLAVGLALVGSAIPARGQEMPPKPTPEHQRLAKEVGTWDATMKTWMGGPNAEPLVSKGVEVVKLMPGGLWLLSEYDGKFGDMDFHGSGHSGYDTKKKKYVFTWVDSIETEILLMEGEYDSDTQTLTMHAKGTDPAGRPYEMKTTTKFEGDDTRVFTMLMKSEETKGELVKVMEITYKKRSK
jgi:hypothetical protein